MKRISLFLILPICGTLLTCTNKEHEESADTSAVIVDVPVLDTVPLPFPSPSKSPSQNSLILINSDGENIAITPDPNKIYCTVATWCHYSKQFVACINDDRVKQIIGDVKFVFLIEENEWPTVRAQIEGALRDGEIKEDDAKIALERISNNEKVSHFVDEDMFASLKGELLFFNSSRNFEVSGFPEIKNPNNNFDDNALEWLIAKGVPDNLINEYKQ